MNETLKQIAIKAQVEHCISHVRLQEFAELIVKECIGCCEQVISDPVPKSIDTFEQGGIHCMDEIKEHFGVEE